MKYNFTKKELDKLMKNMVIIVDTKEQKNNHILDYFNVKKKKYKAESLQQGDYSAFIESNEETKPLGVNRAWYFNDDIAIERKNSVDELASSITDRKRFESEFLRLNKYNTKTILMVEDPKGYENIIRGNYRSLYKPISFLASFETFIARYNLNICFVDKQLSGFKIYKTMYYHVREILKNIGYIEKEE